MFNTYKNPDVSSIPIQGWVLDLVLFFFFPLSFGLCFPARPTGKAHTEWTFSPMVALRSELYKQEKTNTVQIKCFPPLSFVWLLPRPRLVPGVRDFPVSSEAPLMTQGVQRLGKGGPEGVPHLADPSCKTSKWWLLIDPEPACGGGDKAAFVVHLPVAGASLSLLQIGGNAASVGSRGGKRPCAQD